MAARRARKGQVAPARRYSRVPLKPIRIIWHCPRCEDGEMRTTGSVSNNFGTTYFHECHVCGHEDRSDDQHPRIEYENDYEPIEF